MADEFDQYKRSPAKPAEEPTGVVAALKRVGSNIAGIPGAIQHAFTAPPTPEETAHAGGQPNKIGLGFRRLLIEPSEQLRKSADQPGIDQETANLRRFGGSIPIPVLAPMAENIVERGRLGMSKTKGKPGDPTGALTETATWMMLPKLIEETPGAAKAILGKAAKTPSEAIKAVASTDAGRAALQAEEDVGVQFTREQLRKADEAHHAEIERVAKKNQTAKENWEKEHAKIQAENEAGAEQNARKASLVRETERSATDFQQKANAAVAKDGSVRQVANEKYKVVRDAIGDATVPPTPIANAVRRAKTEIIKGVPETTKQFEDILKREGGLEGGGTAAEQSVASTLEYDSVESARRGLGDRVFDSLVDQESSARANLSSLLGEGERPLTFDDLQGYKTELDWKLHHNESLKAGDLRKAVTSVRDALSEEMRQMAARAGVSDQLTEANKYYQTMMETFYDRKSPIRQAMKAGDPGKAGSGIIGLTESGVDKWIKENLEPLSPELAQQARAIRDSARQAKEIKQYTPKNLPDPPTPEPIPQRTAPDIEAAKRKSLEETRSRLRKSRGYNIVPGREQLRKLHGAALGDPEVQRMLSTMTPEEQNMVRQYLSLPPRARLIFEGNQLVGQ